MFTELHQGCKDRFQWDRTVANNLAAAIFRWEYLNAQCQGPIISQLLQSIMSVWSTSTSYHMVWPLGYSCLQRVRVLAIVEHCPVDPCHVKWLPRDQVSLSFTHHSCPSYWKSCRASSFVFEATKRKSRKITLHIQSIPYLTKTKWHGLYTARHRTKAYIL